MDPHIVLTIHFPPAVKELVISGLLDCGIDCFQETEAAEGEDAGIIYYCESEAEAATLFESLLDSVPEEICTQLRSSTSSLVHTNWRDAWKDYAKAIEVSEALLIVPSFLEAKPKPGQLVLRLDPKQAFGTGAHPSTKLSLQAIEVAVRELRPKSFLDIGCGSGVLSIAANRFGIADVVGIDIETATIETARENASENNASQCEFRTTPIAEISERYDLVCANIISSILLELWPHIRRAVAPNGRLILSGLLLEEIQEFSQALNVRPKLLLQEDIWASLVLEGETLHA